jgi:hypothetical protein
MFQLLVRPIVKSTVAQSDKKGTTLRDDVVTGNFFEEILRTLWAKYKTHIKGRAVKNENDAWSVQVPEFNDWRDLIQFKLNKKPVQQTRPEREWNQWLVQRRGQTVLLLIYEYGAALHTRDLYNTFTEACIRPERTDRAGATAEPSLREVVLRLQRQWRSVFRCEIVVWRMWANHITKNLNRSTWETAISEPPPRYIAHLLRPANTPSEQHLDSVTRSASLALEMIDAAIAEHDQLWRAWQSFDHRLQMTRESLATRRTIVEAFVRNLAPPAHGDVADPVPLIVNVEDTEHQE